MDDTLIQFGAIGFVFLIIAVGAAVAAIGKRSELVVETIMTIVVVTFLLLGLVAALMP